MRNGVKPPLADRPAALYTSAKGSGLYPFQCRLYGQEFLLSSLAELFQDFIVIALCGAIIVIRIPRLHEIMFDRLQAGL